MGSKTTTYHVNMLKKYISREPEGNTVPVDDTDGTIVAVASVIHRYVNPKIGEVPVPEGGCQEGTQDAKSGGELPEDLHPEMFNDVPGLESHNNWYLLLIYW